MPPLWWAWRDITCTFLQVKNLRSSVSRAAIACIGDMFSLLGRAMEQVRGLGEMGRRGWIGGGCMYTCALNLVRWCFYIGDQYKRQVFVSLPHPKDLDTLVRTLLHKGGESSGFIREDVEKALGEMAKSVSPARCLMALISGGARYGHNVYVCVWCGVCVVCVCGVCVCVCWGQLQIWFPCPLHNDSYITSLTVSH